MRSRGGMKKIIYKYCVKDGGGGDENDLYNNNIIIYSNLKKRQNRISRAVFCEL